MDAETIKKLIKPLEWRYDDFQSIWCADTILGQYQAWQIQDWACYRLPKDYAGRNIDAGLGIDAAKAAAQADYEARVISALSPEFLSALDTQSGRTEAMRKALEPFKSGGNWGRYKAWLTCGPPTQADGVRAAKQITEWQVAVDRDALEGRTDA